MSGPQRQPDDPRCGATGRATAPGTTPRSLPERVIEQIADDRLDIEPGDTILLIVEDDPHYARVIMDLARDKGFKVLVAIRGADALDLAKQFQPTAVSLDVFLPDMLGWTVLSQLKQNPLTRHIPVQIITLDEDRQHALARGAFSFVTKPTTTEGVEAALTRIKEYAQPRRKRLLVVEDNAAEQLSITELLGSDDIDIVAVGTGAAALAALREQTCDCVVLDLRLPDMSGFEVLEHIRADQALSDVPVVVFTGRELSAEEDAQLHTMARSIVVKGVESPERLLDETALFLHRVITDLPPEKQRMLERLNSSDEDLVGKTVLLVDDDARNIFALSSVLERRGMRVKTATTGREAIELIEFDARSGDRPHGHHDAGNGRLSDDRGDSREAPPAPPADHRADREGDERRSREMSRGRRLRLSRKAGQYRTIAVRSADVAASLRRRGHMDPNDRVNILLVDDQKAKLLSYEVILHELGETLLKATSGREALEHLLRSEIAVVLVDVCMPDLDGFQLAAMIRDHPRFQKTAIIFISAILLSDMDRLRGYEMGAVDYVPVPVIPEVLRAKVKVFAELYRKTRQLERLNTELEKRVANRTAELEASTARLLQSEQRRSLALVAGNMGSWDWDGTSGDCLWDDGQCRIFGVEPENFVVTAENVKALIHPDDWPRLQHALEQLFLERKPHQCEFRVRRPNGETRWCLATAAPTMDASDRIIRLSGVTVDITERRESEVRQALLAREVDHRAKNALAIVQSIVRLTRADSMPAYVAAVEGRITALSRAHTLLSHSRWQGADLAALVEEELAPYRSDRADKIETLGPDVSLQPVSAQTLTLALHELATNAAKYGALSSMTGRLGVSWELKPTTLELHWTETGGPPTQPPKQSGFGTRIIVASIEGQLGGKAAFHWNESGLHCVLAIPRSERIEQPASHTKDGNGADKSHSAAARTFVVTGDRIMVVEDEALVAMVESDALTELGYAVVGPFSKPSDAIAAVRKGDIAAAVLDINLDGVLVYPVAEELTARGIPFVFVTGYGTESIDERFAGIPVLQKPIERETLQRIFTNHEPASPHAAGRRKNGPHIDSARAATS